MSDPVRAALTAEEWRDVQRNREQARRIDAVMALLSKPYIWPTDKKGRRLPQGDCSACRQIDKQHPEGTACDYSCVGI